MKRVFNAIRDQRILDAPKPDNANAFEPKVYTSEDAQKILIAMAGAFEETMPVKSSFNMEDKADATAYLDCKAQWDRDANAVFAACAKVISACYFKDWKTSRQLAKEQKTAPKE